MHVRALLHYVNESDVNSANDGILVAPAIHRVNVAYVFEFKDDKLIHKFRVIRCMINKYPG